MELGGYNLQKNIFLIERIQIHQKEKIICIFGVKLVESYLKQSTVRTKTQGYWHRLTGLVYKTTPPFKQSDLPVY